MMLASCLLALATTLAMVRAQAYQGFNYGSVFTDGSAITQTDYENRFSTAQQLVGASSFTSARLFTMIQAGTTNSPTQAIPAAISTKTSLLLGLFLSSDQAVFNNELAALRSAIATYGQDLIDLIAGVSVGSEDLYRISPIGIENNSGAGVEPARVADYIGQVRSLIAGTAANGKVIGHVDTWTAWVNSSNEAVIDACDFIGMDAYPYFQNTMSNSIDSGEGLFFDAYNDTVSVSGGKPVWITETGWPVSGPTENLAVASIENAQTYWDQVACSVLGKTNTWWYILQDAYPTSPSPSFGLVGTTLSTTPLYNLSCSTGSGPAMSSAATPISSAVSVASANLASSEIPVSLASTIDLTSSSITPVPLAESSKAILGGSDTFADKSAGFSRSLTTVDLSTSTLLSKPGASIISAKTFTTVTTNPVIYTSFKMKTSMTTSTVGISPSIGTQASVTSSNVAVSPAQHRGGHCPSSLSGEFQYPHLIVSVDKSAPDTAQGNGYDAHFTPKISSIFNFDIPPSYKGLTCSLIFFLPTREWLQTSNYTLSGSGGVNVAQLQNPATAETAYNSVSAVTAEIGSVPEIQPGSSYQIASSECAAGTRVGYEVDATGDLDLEYFQDYNPAPIGLYLIAC